MHFKVERPPLTRMSFTDDGKSGVLFRSWDRGTEGADEVVGGRGVTSGRARRRMV